MFNAKKRKISDASLIYSITPNTGTRDPFQLDLSSKDQDAVGFNYIVSESNPKKSENGVLSLPGRWKVGISKFTMNNELITFKKIGAHSIGFLYLLVKLKNVKSIVLPITYFEHKLYGKNEVVNFANESLKNAWNKLCTLNSEGINEVGNVFISTIFCFFINQNDDYAYMKSLGNEMKSAKETWKLFTKIFNKFRKKQYATGDLLHIEVFSSNELISFLGDFNLPLEIENYQSDGEYFEKFDGVIISKRIGVLPFPGKNLSIRANFLQPRLLPLSLNILTNILSDEKLTVVNLSDQQFERFQLLANIPLDTLRSQNSSAINYFPTEINFKDLPIDASVSHISIYITDTYSEKLISLNTGNTFLTLHFTPC